MKRSRWRHLKNKWVISAIILVAIVGSIAWAKSGDEAPPFESAVASIQDVAEEVSVTGAVSAMDKASLAFQKSGTVVRVYAKVGDSVKRGDRLASLDDANDRASLAAAEATLADASRSLTREEMAVERSALDKAKATALNAARESLTKGQNAIFNYADAFFSNPQGANPAISIHVESLYTRNSINNARLEATNLLGSWSRALPNETDAAAAAALSRTSLSSLKGFMSDLSAIVNYLTPNNSGLSQAIISAYVSSMNTGMLALDSAIDSLSSAQTALSAAESSYRLKLAGSSDESIAVLSARADQARSEMEKSSVISPIDGVVTMAEPSAGEFVSAGQAAFTVQGGGFKIEARVPEADIAKVSIGNLASSTLDAYGSSADFPAEVISIDPAETVLEGVPTYKVTLAFMEPDARIRSGMTANLEIKTRERRGVLAVPYRAVIDDKGDKSVRLVSADGMSFEAVPVVTGLRGSSGTIEIVSGISEGDKVVTYLK